MRAGPSPGADVASTSVRNAGREAPGWRRIALDGETARTFARYFVVGGITALVEWLIFVAALYLAGVHYLVAATISFFIATAVNHVLATRYVFGLGTRSRAAVIALVYFASAVGIVINAGTLGACVELLDLHPLVGKVARTAAALAWNFSARHYWIFER